MKPAAPRRILSIAALAVSAMAVGAGPAASTALAELPPRLIVGFASTESVAGQVDALRAAGVEDVTAADIRSADVPALDVASVDVPAGDLAEVRAALLERGDVEFVERDRVARALAWTPNDLQLSEQWALPLLGAFAAWDTARGSGVKIAVVDTGVDSIHPELAGKVEAGWDFVDNDADPMDEQGHGTHVAGIAAGIADNALGVAGLAPNARILAFRSLDQQGSGYHSWIANGITSAVDRGAKVINLSLGGGEGSELLAQAVEYATAHGALVTCASGNEGSASMGYPASYENCLAVGATDPNDVRGSFSNTGTGIDVVAPGVQILSSVKGGGYASWDGTSMATPYASGLAALLYSQHLNRAQVVATITATAKDLGAPGYDTEYGHGRIDAAGAVAAAAGLPVPAADTTPPTISDASVGAVRKSKATGYTTKWRKSRVTKWKVVGRTDYRGTYTWRRTRKVTKGKVVTEFKMRGGRVLRRTVRWRQVRVATGGGKELAVTVTAADDVGVDRVGLSLDGKWLTTDWAPSDGWSLAVPCGSGKLTVHAFDAADNRTSRDLGPAKGC